MGVIERILAQVVATASNGFDAYTDARRALNSISIIVGTQ